MRKFTSLILMAFVCLSSVAIAQPKLTNILFYVGGIPGNEAGYGDVTIELIFDTPMNQTIAPIIHYGLEGQNYPLVLPAGGGWENDKLWQGSFTITSNVPSTSDGNYVFKIFGAESETATKMDPTFSINLENKKLIIARSGELGVSADSLFFGNVTVGQSRDIRLTLTNNSPAVLEIWSISIEQPFYIINGLSSYTIPGKQTRTITIRFTPPSRAKYIGNITFKSNDRRQETKKVYLEGSAIGPQLIHSVKESRIDFGRVKPDSSTQRSFWISNLRAANNAFSDTLRISEMSTNDASFKLSVNSLKIAPGDTDTVVVTFDPEKYLNYKNYRLTISSNDYRQSPKIIFLNGNAEDETPPASISELNVTWSGYSGYSNAKRMYICWDNPNDPSGISAVWWKFSRTPLPPETATDTTDFGGRYLLETGASCAYLPLYGRITSGRWYCYIWLVDGYGNSGYSNAVRTYFVYDITPPGIPRISGRSIPARTWFGNTHNYNLTINISADPNLRYVDATEVRWKYKSNPTSATDYAGKSGFSVNEQNQVTFGIPFNNTSLCGEDSVYFWLADSAGNCSADSFAIARYKFDMCAPTITRKAASYDIATMGNDFDNMFQITDHSFVKSARATYRFGGATAEEPVIVLTQQQLTNDFEMMIPKAGVTKRGIEFKVVAEDSLGHKAYWPSGNFKYDGDGDGGWLPIPTRVEGDGDYRVDMDGNAVPLIKDTDETGFQLFSLPYLLDDNSLKAVMYDDLDDYLNTAWRIFDFYKEERDTSLWREGENIRPFEPGRSYFVITNKENMIVDSGPGKTVKTVDPDTLIMKVGWNLIATPFNFPVHKSSLSFINSSYPISLRSYERGWNITDVMLPWKGYALYVTKTENDNNEGTIKLVIQPKAAPGRIAKATSTPFVLQDDEWVIQISAENESLNDHENWIGFKNGSSEKFDEFDMAEPPVIGKYLTVSIPHSDWEKSISTFSTDLRPNREEDQVWEFAVKTNKTDSEINLSFNFLGSFPQDKEIYLFDSQLKIVKDLKTESIYSFHSGSGLTQRTFKLVFGTKQFAQIQTENVDLIPAEFQVLQNYPNPFNPETSIRFDLNEPSQVQIHIFNLQGQEVRVLANRQFNAGYHNIVWDARDDFGNQVAAGVYVYQITSGKQTQTRKMLFLK